MKTPVNFSALCRDLSLSMQADDADALGEGRPSQLGGETFQILQAADGRTALLLTYLGAAPDDEAASVYEQLLLLQLTGWNNPDIRFGLDPITGQIVLCTRLPGADRLDSVALRTLIQRLLDQVGTWRSTLLQPVTREQLSPLDQTAAA